MISRRTFAASALAIAAGGRRTAFAAEGAVKIGVLSDMSGIYSDFGGRGSVVAATMAIEDFGGSLLGKPVEIVSADHQNKADIGVGVVRRWYDAEGVDVVVDVLNSGLALPVQALAQEKKKIVVFSGLNNKDLSGKLCSPHGFVWGYDSYALGKGAATGIMKAGGKSWFFITIDYSSGHTLEQDTVSVVRANGGAVVGTVRYALGTKDFASFILQAQASKADVIALSTGGADTQAMIKQAAEFGVSQRIVPLFFTTMDIQALGLQSAQGAPVVTDFYWDQTDATRAWSKRFQARHGGRIPTDVQATVYSSTLHYLKAVKQAGSKDTGAVLAAFNGLPVDDFMTKAASIRPDGRLLRDMYFGEVKKPSESTSPGDTLKILTTIPGVEAFRPASESECPLLRR
jgi:branched-chain amino acid transport system substrate-binding protein